MGIMMALPVLDAIPKEMYLLIGTVLGSGVTMVTTLINTRAQERIARETRQQQYELEALKLRAQVGQEARLHLRSKMEEAHQLLSKIAAENSQTESYITLERGMTKAEYHARYQQQQVELQRLQMLVALYFPTLRELTDDLPGLTNQFWGQQQHLIYQEMEGKVPVGVNTTQVELIGIARQIKERIWMAQGQLRTLVEESF
jgi:hypothetical protein